MTNRELLELAAKAVGYPFDDGHFQDAADLDAWWRPWIYIDSSGEPPNDSARNEFWNPLTDDGDALRLAVLLRFWVKDFAPSDSEGFNGEQPFGMIEIWRETDDDPIYVEWYKPGEDRITATRRAIVLAAAEIGKGMK